MNILSNETFITILKIISVVIAACSLIVTIVYKVRRNKSITVADVKISKIVGNDDIKLFMDTKELKDTVMILDMCVVNTGTKDALFLTQDYFEKKLDFTNRGDYLKIILPDHIKILKTLIIDKSNSLEVNGLNLCGVQQKDNILYVGWCFLTPEEFFTLRVYAEYDSHVKIDDLSIKARIPNIWVKNSFYSGIKEKDNYKILKATIATLIFLFVFYMCFVDYPNYSLTYCRGKDKFIFKTISTERPLSRFLNFNKEQKKIFIYDTNENFVEKINVDKVFNKYKIDKLDINTSKDNALFAAGPLLLVIYISLMSLILYGKIRIKRE